MTNSTALVNAVSAYSIILSGLIAMALTMLMGKQPRRWIFVYICIIITGLATVWYHGFGETFGAMLADGGTNLLVAWALQIAILGDYYSRRIQLLIGSASGLVSIAFILFTVLTGPNQARILVVSFDTFGGFSFGELLILTNALIVVGLLGINLERVPKHAKPLLFLLCFMSFSALLLATASDDQLDFQVIAYHATWHLVSSFGFIVLWAFNHTRFNMHASREE